MKNSSQRYVTRAIIQTALLIGLAMVIRNFSTMVYFLGAPGMRITFSPIFSRLPALLFGPFFGGIAGGLTDIMGYLLKPEGPYIPLMTLTAILDGVVVGFLWKGLKQAEAGKIRRVLWIALVCMGILGGFNYVSTLFFPNSAVVQILQSIGKNKDFLVLGLVAVSVIGLILLLLDFITHKKYPQARVNKYYLKLLVAFGTAGLTVTFLNTWILQLFIPELGKMGFVVFLIPRLVKEIFMIVLQSYMAAFLLSLYDRLLGNRGS